VGETVASDRLFTLLLTAFGLLAMALGTVGVYGVMSYAVSQRIREIGIRMAVGASAASVLRVTVVQGMIPVGIGVALGIAGALTSNRVLASTLFGIRPTDAATLAAVPAVLCVTALMALYMPARRASRTDPMSTLRE
jgi:putative ABC transport system permease protein